jgi:hypothetical protein
MDYTLYLVIVLILVIVWVIQFSQLMTLGDEVFPGRYDKALWVAAFLLIFPLAPFAFLWWKQIMVAMRKEEKKQ